MQGTVHGCISIFCAFGMWSGEGVDGTFSELGTKAFAADAAIPFRALVTLTGEIPTRMAIGPVEILPTAYWVQLGDIEPDWQNLLGDIAARSSRLT
ncbi:hypothetical protein [Burkholderia ambifaria]|uniref:hypothetical protein n=1 Tax=Burkholderia ambifaria TaxID=152480 RepID=UPI001589DC3A|nr:hypothetical protein [Burkholderia ambifaria]